MNFVSQAQKKWNYRCVDKTFFCEQLRKSYNLMRLFIRNYSKSNYWYLQERIHSNNVWCVPSLEMSGYLDPKILQK